MGESLINFRRASTSKREALFLYRAERKRRLFNNEIFARTYRSFSLLCPSFSHSFETTKYKQREFIEDQISARYISSLIPDIYVRVNAHCQATIFSCTYARIASLRVCQIPRIIGESAPVGTPDILPPVKRHFSR